MSRTFQVKNMKFCQMIRSVWENDFQAILVDFIFENVGANGRRPATRHHLWPGYHQPTQITDTNSILS